MLQRGAQHAKASSSIIWLESQLSGGSGPPFFYGVNLLFDESFDEWSFMCSVGKPLGPTVGQAAARNLSEVAPTCRHL